MPVSLSTSELGTVSPPVVETVSCFLMCLLKHPQAPSREGGELLKPGAGPSGRGGVGGLASTARQRSRGRVMFFYVALLIPTMRKERTQCENTGRTVVPQRCPRPGPPELLNVTLRGKRVAADGIKLRILGWGDYPGIPGWAQCKHKGPYKREVGGSERERGDVTTETEVRVM